MKRIYYKNLAFLVLMPLMVFLTIAMLIPDYRDYYSEMQKPSMTIGTTLFPIMWGLAYILMGVSAYLTTTTMKMKNEPTIDNQHKKAIRYYNYQLLVSLLWLPITFGLRWRLVSLIWSVLLLVLVFITYRKFSKINKVSGYLFIPYIILVSYLIYLTLMFLILNMCCCGIFCNCVRCTKCM